MSGRMSGTTLAFPRASLVATTAFCGSHRPLGSFLSQSTYFFDSGMHPFEAPERAVPAVIVSIRQETPTVKRFTLVPQGSLGFLPGQWVDFFIPGLSTVGGFSFTSTPRQLQQSGTFELAVKRSQHPPTAWLHDKAQIGDRVAVRVGGSFHYLPGDERRPLLLVAGGIGINPLFSMLKHCCELCEGGSSSRSRSSCRSKSSRGSSSGSKIDRGMASSSGGGSSSAGSLRAGSSVAAPVQATTHGSITSEQAGGHAAPPLPRAAVLYSASVPAELAFRRELEQLQAAAGGSICLRLHVTAPEWRGRDAEWGGHWGRIGCSELQSGLQWLAEGQAAGSASSSSSKPPDTSTSRLRRRRQQQQHHTRQGAAG